VTYERRGLEYRTGDNPSMGHGADGAVMAGEFGILGMDVDSLGKASEPDQQDTGQGQQPESGLARDLSSSSQA